MRCIDADTLYEKTANLEAQALDYVGKLIERDGNEVSTDWKVWSAILTERTAFKHDVYDAPTIEPERKKGKWNFIGDQMFECTKCGTCYTQSQFHQMRVRITDSEFPNFCPNCGCAMTEEGEEE